jgi:hypothetical protein
MTACEVSNCSIEAMGLIYLEKKKGCFSWQRLLP